MIDTITPKDAAALAAVSLFAIGQRVRFQHGKRRVRFQHGKRRVSGVIYDVGPTQYCVTVWFGANHINLGVDHDDATLTNAGFSDELPMTHKLKTWPEYFDAILRGVKTFEIRKNDRNFKVGDKLNLLEWDTGRDPQCPHHGRRR